MDKIALTNVRVFDGERLLEPSTVVIDGDRIGERPGGRPRRSTATAACCCPGLIDCHIHLTDDATLSALARQRRHHRARHGHLAAGAGRVAARPAPASPTSARAAPVPPTRPARTPSGWDARRAWSPIRTRRRPTSPSASPRAWTTSRSSSIPPASTSPRSGRWSKPPTRTACARSPTPPPRDAVLLAQAAGVDVLTHAPIDRPLEDGDVRRDARIRAGRRADPDDDGGDRRAAGRRRARLLRRRPIHRRAVVPGGRHDPRRDRRQPGAVRARVAAVRHQPAPRTGAARRRGPVRRRCRCGRRRSSRRSNSGWPTGGHRAGQAGRPGAHRR